MNIRKPVDYSGMFAALDEAMAANLPQMELYFEIGRLVCGRPEKGAAVMAAEYLTHKYSDTAGFSPRNLRRMREFCRSYADGPSASHENRVDAECDYPGSRADTSREGMVHPHGTSIQLDQSGTAEADRGRCASPEFSRLCG